MISLALTRFNFMGKNANKRNEWAKEIRWFNTKLWSTLTFFIFMGNSCGKFLLKATERVFFYLDSTVSFLSPGSRDWKFALLIYMRYWPSVRSRWLDISRVLFFAFQWTGTKSRSIEAQKKGNDAYIEPS